MSTYHKLKHQFSRRDTARLLPRSCLHPVLSTSPRLVIIRTCKPRLGFCFGKYDLYTCTLEDVDPNIAVDYEP